jgi:methylmalonyl-CoA/ethylmalonyl-CoA epimerase
MKPTHIEHIGIAVKDLAASIRFYEDVLGLRCYGIEEVEDQQARTAFFRIGQIKIELLESLRPDGPIGKFLEKKGEGLHHIALAVEDLAGSLRELQEKGVRLLDEEPRPGSEGMQIAFLHPTSTGGVLTELCSVKKK